MGLGAYVLVGMAMFVLGVFTIVSRRNAVYILMGAELILNAASLNFVAFNRYGYTAAIDGQMFAIFIIILAAAEAAVALAIILQLFHHFGSIDVTEVTTLKE
ncbi:MAG: NADH-quinone oxidoreductase subunit NuoK [Planctomycetota bacterium]